MKAIGLCSAFNRMSNLKRSLTGFWLGLEKKMQLIRLFLNLPLCLMAVDLQIVACWESQTLRSVLLSGGEGSFPLMGLSSTWAVSLLEGTAPWEVLLPSHPSVPHGKWHLGGAADEPGFYSLHWWLISLRMKEHLESTLGTKCSLYSLGIKVSELK